jgi:hypothetical protein
MLEKYLATAFEIRQTDANRFVKKQQMRWTQRGVYLLLQIRVQVLRDYPEVEGHVISACLARRITSREQC